MRKRGRTAAEWSREEGEGVRFNTGLDPHRNTSRHAPAGDGMSPLVCELKCEIALMEKVNSR